MNEVQFKKRQIFQAGIDANIKLQLYRPETEEKNFFKSLAYGIVMSFGGIFGGIILLFAFINDNAPLVAYLIGVLLLLVSALAMYFDNKREEEYKMLLNKGRFDLLEELMQKACSDD